MGRFCEDILVTQIPALQLDFGNGAMATDGFAPIVEFTSA